MVQAFHADVREGWSSFIGEWFTPGLRTRSIFNPVQVRVQETFASSSSKIINFRVQVRVRQK